MTEKIIGYARIACSSGDIHHQIVKLKEAGCDEVFTDIGSSNGSADLPGLSQAKAALRPGDKFMVCAIDRISRSNAELEAFTRWLMSNGMELRSAIKPDEAAAFCSLVNYQSALLRKPLLQRLTHRAGMFLLRLSRL